MPSSVLAATGCCGYSDDGRRSSHIYRESRSQLTALLERGVRRREVTAKDVSAVAALLTATIEGLLLQTSMDDRFDAHRVARRLAIDTLRSRAATAEGELGLAVCELSRIDTPRHSHETLGR